MGVKNKLKNQSLIRQNLAITTEKMVYFISKINAGQ
jgi:hypothetical protein